MSPQNDLWNLKSKVVVISGALGLIGSTLAEELIRLGAEVVKLDKQKDSNFHADGSTYVDCDVSSSNSVQEKVMVIEKEIGPIYALINCASTRTDDNNAFFAATESYDLDVWDEVLDVNLKGTYLLSRCIGEHMKLRGEGFIVNFASIYGATMGPDERIYRADTDSQGRMNTPISYAVSKGGVVALTKFLATTWAPFGINVNCVSPGGVKSNQSLEFIQAYSGRIPLGRMAEVLEIIGAPIFLISPAAKYITGQNLFIDGGLSAW